MLREIKTASFQSLWIKKRLFIFSLRCCDVQNRILEVFFLISLFFDYCELLKYLYINLISADAFVDIYQVIYANTDSIPNWSLPVLALTGILSST